MKRILYYAVSGRGHGNVFTEPPARNEHFKIWEGRIEGCYSSVVADMESRGLELPNISWDDDPAEITLSIE